MKNFFSQTWVVAVIALIILCLVGSIWYKTNHKDNADYTKSEK